MSAELDGHSSGRDVGRRWKRWVAAGGGLAVVTGAFVTQAGPSGAVASSHREAPLIAGDPRADNTDLYAFVSPDAPDTVTLIANWIPFEEPNGGPNFYTWADDTRYNIKIDNDGDARPDYTYTWIFDTVIRDPNQFLNNTGAIESLTDPDLNVYQTYDLTVTDGAGNTTVLLGDGDGENSPGDPIAAPSLVGPASTPNYGVLRDQAIYNLPGGGKTYSGQADDPFFLDLRVFDLLYGGDASEVGQDTLAGYNVNSIALQVPKSELAINDDPVANPVIGIWSTTDRRSAAVQDAPGTPDNDFVQVSRLGNPLVNEVVVPLALKDAFNAIRPRDDAGIPEVVDKVLNPILPGLIQAIYGVPAPAGPRNDLFEIFLTGVTEANENGGDPAVLPVDLNSQSLNEDASVAFRPSEMLRLNMSVPPTAKPNRYGVIAGDIAGFPNGRRLADDVVDVAIQVVEGAALTGQLVQALLTIDSVDRNDREFGATFPYLALPHTDAVNTGVDRSPRAAEFISVSPQRILETRTDQPGGQVGYTGAKPAAGQTLTLKVAGAGNPPVPTDASTVLINVTAMNTAANGFVTVYPCGSTRPLAASFNPVGGVITHNLVAAPVAADGTVCIYTSSSTDLVADLAGYHPSGSDYTPVVPQRLLETRTTEGGQQGYTGAKPTAGQTIQLDVTGVGAANVPNDAKAVFLNVATVNSSSVGFVTVYACGTSRPLAANLTTTPGVVRANLVVAPVGAGGNVCLYVNQGTDLVADIQGYVPGTSPYVPVAPQRVLETRESEGQIGYSAAMPRAGQTTEVKVTGVGTAAIPADAGAVYLNVSVVNAASNGFITVFPCGTTRPLAANLNLTGETKTNLVAAKVGDGGRVCIYTSQPTDLTVDLAGYFPGSVLPS